MLMLWSFLMHGLQHQVLNPLLILHPLPHLGCHLVEADVEGWDGRGLVERFRAGEVVLSGAEGEPQSTVYGIPGVCL